MGNKLRDEDLNLNIIVNGDKGKKELGDLEKSTRELTNSNKELRAEREKLKRAGKEESERYKEISIAIRENNKTIKTNEARMTELRKAIGLTGLTMRQLRTEQTRLKRLMDSSTPGTAQWKEYRNELMRVELQMKKVRVGSKTMQLSIGSIADGFNRFSIMGAAVIGTITGITLSARNFISGMVDLDDQLANVMKTTGLTREQVREMYRDFRQLNTRTPRKELLLLAEEAGRLGKKSRQDVMDFVEVANQIKVSLGDDLGGEAEVAIREVGKLTDIYKVGEEYGTDFKESMLKVGSAINEVSANSQAQAPFLINYLKRMGGVAGQAKINAAAIIGYGSALDQLGQREEMASTAVGKVIVDMFTDTAKYASIAKLEVGDFTELLKNDANKAFLALLDGLNGNNEGFSVMANKLDALGLDGNRAVQVLAALASNTDKIRKEQDLANRAMDQGVSLTNEYNIKNNNLAASWNKLGQYIHTKFINSGFLGYLEKVVGKMSEWTEVKLADTLRDEQTELNLLVASITNSNNTQETRNSLIKELQEAYPDFLKNLDSEKVTNEELGKRLEEVNSQYENRILLAVKEDKLQGNYKERADLKLKELDLVKDIARKESEIADLKKKQAEFAPQTPQWTEYSRQIFQAETDQRNFNRQLDNTRDKFADLQQEEAELNAAIKDLMVTTGGSGGRTGGNGGTGGNGRTGSTSGFDNTPGVTKVENVTITEKQNEVNALKSLEDDWLNYQKQADEEGQKLSENNIKRWEDEKQAKQDLTNAYISAAGQTIDALIEMAGKESTIGKALFLLNQARAVGEVIFNTAIANSKAVEMFPITGGMPWVAINTATAAGSIATILGQTIANFSVKGKKEGGFADESSSDNEIAGFYHTNEWIASAPAVRNPDVRKFIDVFQEAQGNGTIRHLNFNEILQAVSGSTGKKAGGFSTSSQVSNTTNNNPGQGYTTDPEMKELLRKNIEVNERMMKWNPKLSFQKLKELENSYDRMMKNSEM